MTTPPLKRLTILLVLILTIAAFACTSDDEAVTTGIEEPTSEVAFIQTAEATTNEAVGIDLDLANSEQPLDNDAEIAEIPPETTSTDSFELALTESSQADALPTSFTANLNGDNPQVVEDIPAKSNDLVNQELSVEDQAASERDDWETRLVNIWKNSIDGVVLINLEASLLLGDGTGAGWFWDEQGHIVTNYHVVRPTSTFGTPQNIIVETFDGDRYDAEYIGGDPVSDIAVIKIDADPATLNPLRLGDSAELQPGMTAVALGHPFGVEQSFSMTHGIISGLARSIQSQGVRIPIPAVIQTDADMNPGNSGGPLLNSSGEVIGVNTQIRSPSGVNSGIGFATPINLVRRVVNNLIQHGVHEYSLIGISSWVITPSLAQQLNLDEDIEGLLVTSVSIDGPAHKAGIIPDSGVISDAGIRGPKGDGDIVLRINNVTISDIEDLRGYIMLNTSPGDEIVVEVLRDGQIVPITLTLGSWGDQLN